MTFRPPSTTGPLPPERQQRRLEWTRRLDRTERQMRPSLTRLLHTLPPSHAAASKHTEKKLLYAPGRSPRLTRPPPAPMRDALRSRLHVPWTGRCSLEPRDALECVQCDPVSVETRECNETQERASFHFREAFLPARKLRLSLSATRRVRGHSNLMFTGGCAVRTVQVVLSDVQWLSDVSPPVMIAEVVW